MRNSNFGDWRNIPYFLSPNKSGQRKSNYRIMLFKTGFELTNRSITPLSAYITTAILIKLTDL
jgi:hypothetical protein